MAPTSKVSSKVGATIGALLQRIGVKVASGVTFVGSPDWKQVIDLTQETTPDAEALTTLTAAVTSAYAFAALDWRAKRVAEPPLWVARETPEGDVWERSHPLSQLFQSPREDMGMGELIERTQRYRDTTGAAIWVIDRDVRNRAAQLVPFSALEFRVKSADGLIYGAYDIRIKGAWRPVDRRNVVHFRDNFGASWHTPTSRLDVALQNVNLGHSVTLMLRKFMLRAMFPGGVVAADPKWEPTPADWTAFKEAIKSWYGGPANAGVPLVLKGGATFTRAALGAQDLVPSEVLDRVEASVGSVFGIPPIVLGWLAGLRNSPWSQAEQMSRQAYSDTIVPIWTGIAEVLTRTLLTPDERERGNLRIKFDTAGVRAIAEDDERRARIQAMNAGIWTVDERRLYTGKERIGGDDGERIAGLFTFGGFGGPSLPAGETEDTDEEEDEEVDDDATDDEDEETPPKRRRLLLARKALKAAKAIWADFDAATKAHEPSWETSVFAELQQQRAEIVALARKTLETKGRKAIDRDSASDFQLGLEKLLKETRPRTRAILEPLILNTGGQAVRTMSARFSIGFDLLQPGLNDFASRESDFLAKVMGETTGKLVAKAVGDGLAEGDTIARMVDRLETLPGFSTTRAKLTARTETTRAWNGAQRESLSTYAKDSGRVATKTWLSSQDGRVRPEHEALNGEQRGIDEPFSNNLQAPGEPNCRCTLTYAVTDSLRGNA